MKGFGVIMTVVGVIYLILAFNMDVSVSTSSTYIPGIGSVGGGEVANLDLMARRQNHLIIAALITLIGVLLAIFGSRSEGVIGGSASNSLIARDPPKPVAFEGEAELSNDTYQLWLAKTHDIERNEVFQKFVMGDRTFNSLDEALAAAHQTEVQKERAALAANEASKARYDELFATAAAERERADAHFDAHYRKYIVAALIVLALIVGGAFALREGPEERAARLAREAEQQAVETAKTEKQLGVTLPSDAFNIEVREGTTDDDIWCNDTGAGAKLARFNTNEDEESIKKKFAESLGKGQPKYEGASDWRWDKGGKTYMLTHIEPTNGDARTVYFCVAD